MLPAPKCTQVGFCSVSLSMACRSKVGRVYPFCCQISFACKPSLVSFMVGLLLLGGTKSEADVAGLLFEIVRIVLDHQLGFLQQLGQMLVLKVEDGLQLLVPERLDHTAMLLDDIGQYVL